LKVPKNPYGKGMPAADRRKPASTAVPLMSDLAIIPYITLDLRGGEGEGWILHGSEIGERERG